MNSLKRIMAERGIKPSQLASMTDIPESTVFNVLHGRHKLSPERVKLVAEALAVDAAELEDVTGTRSPWHEKNSALTPKPKPEPEALAIGEKKEDPEIERLWLYLRQLERRVRDLEAAR